MSLWGRRDQDEYDAGDKLQRPSEEALGHPVARPIPAVPESPPAVAPPSNGTSRLSSTVTFQGEIHSDEDLRVDGNVDGIISVPNHTLVIGPNSQVTADIQAYSFVVQGQFQGKANVLERTDVKREGRLEGDVMTHRLVVEDGAIVRGSIEVRAPDTIVPNKRDQPTADLNDESSLDHLREQMEPGANPAST